MRGERDGAAERIFTRGVRKTVLQPDEMVVDIAFPALRANQRGTFVKFALRRAQAISLVNAAIILTLDGQMRSVMRRSPLGRSRQPSSMQRS